MQSNNELILKLDKIIKDGNKLLKTKYHNGISISLNEEKSTKWYTNLKMFIDQYKNFSYLLNEPFYGFDASKRVQEIIYKLEVIKDNTNNNIIEENNNIKNSFNIMIDKDIYNHIERYLEVEDYYHAIEEAYKINREKLREIVGDEKANNAFKDENLEKIFGHKPKSQTEKDFFDGIKFLHMSIQMFRNENFHNLAKNLDKNQAYHYIVLASLAYQLINNKNE